MAVIVNPELPLGLLANTVGTIATGLGARFTVPLRGQLTDAHGYVIDVSAKLPLPILQGTPVQLQTLLLKAGGADDERAVVVFPAFARTVHDYAEYAACFNRHDLSTTPLDGIGLYGPEKWVKSLTGSLKLLR